MSEKSSQYPVSLVIKHILTDRLNGELVIQGENFSKSLFFLNGDLIFARSDIFDERIGVLLYLLGKINDQQYDYISGLVHSVDLEVGKILVQNNFISTEDLHFSTLFQMKKIALNAFTIERVEWELLEKKPEGYLPQEFKIPLSPIIAEGARKIEDISFFINKIQFLSPETIKIPKPIKQLMTNEEIVLYRRMGDCKGMSNREIISKLNLDPEIYWKKMVLFILLDIVDFSEHEVEYNIGNEIQRLIEFEKKLKTGNLNHCDILGVPSSSTKAEFKNAFLKLSKMFDPDRFGSAAAPEIKKIAYYVHEEIKNAYQMVKKKYKEQGTEPVKKDVVEFIELDEIEIQPDLQEDIHIDIRNEVEGDELKLVGDDENLQFEFPEKLKKESKKAKPATKEDLVYTRVSEKDVQKKKGKAYRTDTEKVKFPEEVKKEIDSDFVEKEKNLLEKAEELYKDKKYTEAAGILKAGVKTARHKGDYYYLLGLCQTHMEFYQEEAEKHLRKAIEINPWNSDPVFALGILFRLQDKKKQAEKCFERVMSMTGDHTRAVKAIRELSQRKKQKGSLFSFLKKDISKK